MEQIEQLTAEYIRVHESAYKVARASLLSRYVNAKYGNGSYNLTDAETANIESKANEIAHNVTVLYLDGQPR